MKSYSFYHRETGVIHPKKFGTDDTTQLAGNTPVDHAAIEGYHDHLSKRFDFEAKQVVEWIPPAPSADHVWNPETLRWQESAATMEKIARRNAALVRIALLEASQHRHVREHALGMAGALEALQAIDAEIVSLRPDLMK